jgi:hypothetical protein
MCASCLDHLETAVQAYLRQTHSVIPLSPAGSAAAWHRGSYDVHKR